MIRVSNLTKFYGAVCALDDVSFEIDRGEVVGFLGPNGAGKSTTMRILTGFLAPTRGSAWVADMPTTGAQGDFRRRLGYLPESAPSYPEMTVRRYLTFVADIHGLGKQGKRKADEAMDRCGLRPVAERRIEGLSKGFTQRVGLAAAILHGPEVLILDEPTSGLDPNQMVEIQELIRDLSTERTILLSSHILPEVQAVASRVLILNEGVLVADDTPDALGTGVTSSRLLLRVMGPDPEAARARLSVVEGVTTVTAWQDGDHLCIEVIAPREVDVRPRVARAVVESGWSLLEMVESRANLQEVFRRLTEAQS